MILGIGSDLCDIRRIERTIARFGDRFLYRVFTAEERRKALSRANPARTFAKRFAAKEATTKALGTGFRAGVHFRDIGARQRHLGPADCCLIGRRCTPSGAAHSGRLYRPHRLNVDR